MNPIIQLIKPRFISPEIQKEKEKLKKCMEDLEGWEILPEYGYLEVHDDGGKKFFSRKCYMEDSNTVIKDYFSPSQLVDETTKPSSSSSSSSMSIPRLPNQLLTLPVDDHGGELMMKINILPEKIESPGALEAEKEVSQICFKKMQEAEFAANMKMESPRSGSNKAIEVVGEAYKNDQQNGRLNNIWRRWSLNGIGGAICSFGVAAATLCIIFIGNSQKHNRKPCFQIYTDDKKRINQVVLQLSSNEAN